LITIGLKGVWDYPFIVSNSIASAQVFGYLPNVLEYPFNYTTSNISVAELVPFTSSNVDYIITVAEVYFPKDDVAELQALILDSSSSIYNNPDATYNEFADLIDRSIPITGVLDKLNTGSTSSSGTSSGSTFVNSGAMEYSQSGVSGASKAETGKNVGIAIGSVVGATTYIALLILGARYYIVRKRVKLESGSNSFLDSASNGSAESLNHFVYGAGVRASAQSQQMSQVDNYIPQISKPVATQNSLGWS
jgi:hypothetical protein